jgi:hypothetical protein
MVGLFYLEKPSGDVGILVLHHRGEPGASDVHPDLAGRERKVGVVAPDISWGAMLAEGRQYLRDSWWVVAFPGLAITLLVLTINLLGDALREAYDPRKRTYR